MTLPAAVQHASQQNLHLSELNSALIMIIGHIHTRNEWYVRIRSARLRLKGQVGGTRQNIKANRVREINT